MTDDVVDVLIIGAGASGAAVAWSLADTRMRIVCLEQGDWTNPADYPHRAVDWESQAFGDLPHRPQRARPRLPTIRSTTTIRRSRRSTSTEWAAARSSMRRTSRACTLGLPRQNPGRCGGRLAHRLRDAGALLRSERPHDGGGRPGRRSRCIRRSSRRCRRCPWGDWARRWRAASTGWGGTGGRRTAPSSPSPTKAGQMPAISGPASSGCAQGAQGERRHHLLAARDPPRRRAAHTLPRARDHRRRARHGDGVVYYDADGRGADFSAPRWWSWHAMGSARRGCC